MIIDLVTFTLFVLVGTGMVFMVWRKIPLLLQLPEQLIEESFLTRPSRLKSSIAPIANFFGSARYRSVYRGVLVWVLYRVRLWLLRFERIVFRMIEALRNEETHLIDTGEHYFSGLKQWKQESRQEGAKLPDAVLTSEPPPPAVLPQLTRRRTSRVKGIKEASSEV